MNDLHTAELAEAIRRGRCALGLGITETARRAGIHSTTLRSLESAQNNGYPRSLRGISHALGVSEQYLHDVLRGNTDPRPCPIHQDAGCPSVHGRRGRPTTAEVQAGELAPTTGPYKRPPARRRLPSPAFRGQILVAMLATPSKVLVTSADVAEATQRPVWEIERAMAYLVELGWVSARMVRVGDGWTAFHGLTATGRLVANGTADAGRTGSSGT